MSPAEGPASIVEHAVTGGLPAGYTVLGQQVTIEAPSANAQLPLVVTFVLDASILPADLETLNVFRDGIPVAACAGDFEADPDPCVGDQLLVGGGDLEVTVRTSAASEWTFAASAPDPDPLPPPALVETALVPTPGGVWVTLSYDPERSGLPSTSLLYLDVDSVPHPDDFTVRVDGVPVAVATVSVMNDDGFPRFVVVELAPGVDIAEGADVRADYEPGATPIRNAGGLTAPSFSDVAVPSRVGQVPTYGTIGEGGGTVSTDVTETGATAARPLVTEVTSPVGGSVTIAPAAGTAIDSGYRVLGQAVHVTAPAGTPGDPLVLSFIVDASALPSGVGAEEVEVFRNGDVVATCADPSNASADPDPCVSSRLDVSEGDVRITVRTSHASTWALGALNAAPVVGPIGTAVAPVAVGSLVNASALVSDADASDTVIGTWHWGDGQTSAATFAGNVASASHRYTAAGVYTVSLDVSDGANLAQAAYEFVVAYDPNSGFVTGGGWITSPAGAYVPDPALVGRANFGFVAKYQKGASVPKGSTEFTLHGAGLDFQSSSLDWLVLSGAKAQYRGTGVLNGEGGYAFLLTAVDGAQSTGSADRFRMRIWHAASGAVVYDNEHGAATNGTPTTVIEGGSIVIHRPK